MWKHDPLKQVEDDRGDRCVSLEQHKAWVTAQVGQWPELRRDLCNVLFFSDVNGAFTQHASIQNIYNVNEKEGIQKVILNIYDAYMKDHDKPEAMARVVGGVSKKNLIPQNNFRNLMQRSHRIEGVKQAKAWEKTTTAIERKRNRPAEGATEIDQTHPKPKQAKKAGQKAVAAHVLEMKEEESSWLWLALLGMAGVAYSVS